MTVAQRQQFLQIWVSVKKQDLDLARSWSRLGLAQDGTGRDEENQQQDGTRRDAQSFSQDKT